MENMLKELKEWMIKYNCSLTASVDLLNSKTLKIGINKLHGETIVLREVDIIESSPNNDDANVGVLDVDKIQHECENK